MKFAISTGMGALLLAGSMNMAQALPYGVTGGFSNPGFSDPYTLSYLVNNDDGANGALPAVAEFGWGVNLDTLASSRFVFDGYSNEDPDFVPLPELFPITFGLGSFEYTNLETRLAGDVITVDLDLSVYIGDAADPVTRLDFSYGLRVENTAGEGTPDSMQIVSMPDSMIFNVNDTDYMLELLGFGRGETTIEVAENDTARGVLFARVDRLSPVPLPASVWLFGSALIGLAGVARRKSY